MTTTLTRISCGIALAAAASFASATPIVLDFEGVGDQASIDDFYNGGTDSDGNSGTDYGIEFSGNTLGLIDQDAGGAGNFANEPSPDTVLFWLDDSSAILNVPMGFETGFSFFYTSSTDATINIYDGLDATGTLLNSIDLAAQFTANGCTGDPTGAFCNWDAIGASFAGTAFSIDFGGTANFTGYDDITFGSVTPGPVVAVPEPEIAGLAMLVGIGMVAIGYHRRKRVTV